MSITKDIWSSFFGAKIVRRASKELTPSLPGVRTLMNPSPWRRGLFLIPLVVACFALSPTIRAVMPPPDGGYPNGNTAEGDGALLNLTTGIGNTATGSRALSGNTTGDSNTASGINALFKNTTSDNNTATGAHELESNTTGDSNTANGSVALVRNTSGSQNTATGRDALFNNTTGGLNTASGNGALANNSTAFNNTASAPSRSFPTPPAARTPPAVAMRSGTTL